MPIKTIQKLKFKSGGDEYHVDFKYPKTIDELTDVTISQASNGQVLTYQDGQFVNKDSAAKVQLATTKVAGIVKPDGQTIAVRDDGTIYTTGGGGGSAKLDVVYVEQYPNEVDMVEGRYYVKTSTKAPVLPSGSVDVEYVDQYPAEQDMKVGKYYVKVGTQPSGALDDYAKTEALTQGLATKISTVGTRGALAGFETADVLTGAQTITKDSKDTTVINVEGTVTITFTPALDNETATKVVKLKATNTTTLTVSGAVWANKGKAPTWGQQGKNLILVANFIGGEVILTVFHNDQ